MPPFRLPFRLLKSVPSTTATGTTFTATTFARISTRSFVCFHRCALPSASERLFSPKPFLLSRRRFQSAFSEHSKPSIPRTNLLISRWLLSSCGFVVFIILIGGITRLTESGLSIVDWKPLRGVRPPLTEEEWREEFERYQQFPEYLQTGGSMTLSEFKCIFWWEWFHRFAARSVGVVYTLPFLYFSAKGAFRNARGLQGALAFIGLLGASQGALGWYMVQSGLDEEAIGNSKATVSAYRLTAHLCLALIIHLSMLRIALRLRGSSLPIATASTETTSLWRLRLTTHISLGTVFITTLLGASVAGLDAGLLYSGPSFPYMGEGMFPPWEDVLAIDPLWRNVWENGVAAQLAHRLGAGLSVLVIGLLNLSCREVLQQSSTVASKQSIKGALRGVNHALGGQIMLGFATLILQVPISVALVHQLNAVILLSMLIRLSARLGRKRIQLVSI